MSSNTIRASVALVTIAAMGLVAVSTLRTVQAQQVTETPLVDWSAASSPDTGRLTIPIRGSGSSGCCSGHVMISESFSTLSADRRIIRTVAFSFTQRGELDGGASIGGIRAIPVDGSEVIQVSLGAQPGNASEAKPARQVEIRIAPRSGMTWGTVKTRDHLAVEVTGD